MPILKKLLTPQVIVPALLSIALLVILLNIADASRVAFQIAREVPRAVLPVFFLTLFYLIVKGVQWGFYLRLLGIRPGWRKLLVPFVAGELGGSLPLGMYMENYLLKGMGGVAIGRSFAATTWMLITELVLCLLALLLVGIPGWPWLRPLAGGMLVGMVLFGWVLFKLRVVRRWLWQWQPRWRWLQSLVKGAREFLEGGSQLFSWRTFVCGVPLTATYLGAYAASLYSIGKGAVPTFTGQEAVAAFAFSTVVVLVASVLPNLGATETAGLVVLLQFGVHEDHAVSILLTMRVLTTGTIALACVVVLMIFYHQVAQSLRNLSHRGDEPGQEGMEEWKRKQAEA